MAGGDDVKRLVWNKNNKWADMGLDTKFRDKFSRSEARIWRDHWGRWCGVWEGKRVKGYPCESGSWGCCNTAPMWSYRSISSSRGVASPASDMGVLSIMGLGDGRGVILWVFFRPSASFSFSHCSAIFPQSTAEELLLGLQRRKCFIWQHLNKQKVKIKWVGALCLMNYQTGDCPPPSGWIMLQK